MELLTEFFQVDFSVSMYGKQIVIAFLVIPKEEVDGDTFRMRYPGVTHFFHGKYWWMLCYLKGDVMLLQKIVDSLFIVVRGLCVFNFSFFHVVVLPLDKQLIS